MLRNAKIDLLRNVTLFSGCSKRDLGYIARIADEIDFPAGKTLITQGEPGRQCFVLIEGSVDVVKDGKKVPPRGSSEIFGEISLLSGGPCTATVTTTAPSRLLVISPQAFQSLLDTSPSIQRRVLHTMSERLAPHVL